MKIVGFAQLHDELIKGNLHNFLRCMDECCDEIFIYDQASTDGSREVYKQYPKVRVLLSDENAFGRELACKQQLLSMALDSKPDWIVWMDGDTLMDGRLLLPGAMQTLCDACWTVQKLDNIRMGHYNLWRSDRYYRIDSSFHVLHQCGVRAIWKNTGKLRFPTTAGLHMSQSPQGLQTDSWRVGRQLIHRGFSTDYQLVRRIQTYLQNGMQLRDFDRFFDEHKLSILPVPDETYPAWYRPADETQPATEIEQGRKKPLRQVYAEYLEQQKGAR